MPIEMQLTITTKNSGINAGHDWAKWTDIPTYEKSENKNNNPLGQNEVVMHWGMENGR